MKTVPKLNPAYWALMLLCTTMGELIGNLISRNFELGYTQGALIDVCFFSLAIALMLVLRLRNQIFYWTLILIGNIGGTNLADWVTLEPLAGDKKWGWLSPLQLGTKLGSLAVMSSLLIVLLVRWMIARRQKSESPITSIFYWFAILLSSTFGTTSGDLITNDTPLGALGGSIMLLIVLLFVFAAYKKRMMSEAAAYWAALVLMHPVGATIGNWVSKPIGLNLGNVYTNVFMITLFFVIYARDGRLHSSTDLQTA